MARVKITIPEQHIYQTEIVLTINFINYGGHMGNDAILTLCQEARIRFLKQAGFSELDFYGKSLIQADAAMTFKSEVFHNDCLNFKLYITDINDYGFDFIYQVTNKETNKEIARVKTGMVFFDYKKRKISKSPSEFLSTFHAIMTRCTL